MKLRYEEYLQKTSLTKAELLAYSWNNLIEDPPIEGCGILPAPPLLMFDRVTEIVRAGRKGRIVAEQDIALDDWFFQCHFRNDPVQPGCLGVDAVWQLVGLYATLRGAKGAGRALGVKEIEFHGQIRPHNKVVRYEIDIHRYFQNEALKASFAIGSAQVFVDDECIYTIREAKSGIFVGIGYTDYPHLSQNSLGGPSAT
jgi:3-hydroxyacyl-[acyl-carrier protein] dehydratase/trans-2-decenoyl-[acyl-carrier protein] isomerase